MIPSKLLREEEEASFVSEDDRLHSRRVSWDLAAVVFHLSQDKSVAVGFASFFPRVYGRRYHVLSGDDKFFSSVRMEINQLLLNATKWSIGESSESTLLAAPRKEKALLLNFLDDPWKMRNIPSGIDVNKSTLLYNIYTAHQIPQLVYNNHSFLIIFLLAVMIKVHVIPHLLL